MLMSANNTKSFTRVQSVITQISRNTDRRRPDLETRTLFDCPPLTKMSWFARSIANSLKFDDEDDEVDPKQLNDPNSEDDEVSSPTSPSRGVKEDLSEISKTLTRQFWGVASFLAPPPQAEPKSDPDTPETEQDPVAGIRGDFAEIGGKFRSGISRLSNNINVSEITKLASNFLQLESDDENEERGEQNSSDSSGKGAVGVTEEVLAFARDISMHPETWLDFPLPENDGGSDDFDLSDAQQEHALAVERLAPRLAALRIELCPGYMTENCFWKIYFVLLCPRLEKQDAELLSTPQVLEARASLARELKYRNTTSLENLSERKSFEAEENVPVFHQEDPLSVPLPVHPENESKKASVPNIGTPAPPTTSETVKPSGSQNDIPIEEKDAVQEVDLNLKPASKNVIEDKDEDDDWLQEESSEIGEHVGKSIPIENDDDVSFSDLEDDDGDAPTSYRKSNDSSDKDSRDWVQLGKSSPESSKDIDGKHSDKGNGEWLDVDDIVVS